VIEPSARHLVRLRAKGRCEYCLLLEDHSELKHHVEHVIAKQHGGTDDLANLALPCHRCNLRKGPNLSGIDPLTDKVVRLFNPRQDAWDDHFKLEGLTIEGITPTGRATVQVMAMNDARRVELRQALLTQGKSPMR